MKHDLHLTGTMTTVTPLTYTLPNCKGIQLMGGKPYFPATAIRGRLRRCARDILSEAMGVKLNFDDFYALTIGGIKQGEGKDSKKYGKNSIHVMRMAEQFNPIMSIFGAMSPTSIPSKLAVSHAIAKEAAGIEAYKGGAANSPLVTVHLSRADDVIRNPAQVMDLLSDEFEEQYLAYTDVTRIKSAMKTQQINLQKLQRKASGDEKKELSAQIADLEQQIKDCTEVSIMQIPDYEAIQPGVAMDVSFRLMNATEAEINIFLRTLHAFACHPVLGGRVAQGNGVVKGDLIASVREARKLDVPLREVGTVWWYGDFTGLNIQSDPLANWLGKDLPLKDWNLDSGLLMKAAKGVME